ncbi:glucose-6-phosphate isomerase family protein [Aestuariimicrobium ganziense]|uniref:glucose-6-phosphate isomerase family protein n=1 Tax=Aestuariimicrobium ganziense TaxID=2773677 RepID=UPI001944B4BB|nr:glucose-6-phosphate isomerase family protein [Aestuariimicrobium ganziense]
MKLEASGLDLGLVDEPLGFEFGEGLVHPPLERRRLDDIRASLRDPSAHGPEVLYSIAMDVCERDDHTALVEQNLLFGICAYSSGLVGNEPVRSQGHVHAISASCGSSTGELYEFWAGEGIVYMQEFSGDDPGRCFAVRAGAGETVLVPPGWAHLTVNATPHQTMAFGAWCVRDYGFDYTEVRARQGLAWYPVVEDDQVCWVPNLHYRTSTLVEKSPDDHREFGIEDGPIYRQWQQRPRDFDFIRRPDVAADLWKDYTP